MPKAFRTKSIADLELALCRDRIAGIKALKRTAEVAAAVQSQLDEVLAQADQTTNHQRQLIGIRVIVEAQKKELTILLSELETGLALLPAYQNELDLIMQGRGVASVLVAKLERAYRALKENHTAIEAKLKLLRQCTGDAQRL